MPTYTFLTEPSSEHVEQILRLYAAAGWWALTPDAPAEVVRLISGSHCFLTAVAEGEIIGMGRAISDGASDAYIQDVTVREDYRGQGIATKIVSRLTERLHADGISWVGLIAEENTQTFYQRIGFDIMPASVPMILKEK